MTYSVVTALRAKRMGLLPSRHFGYYVLVTPKPSYLSGNASIGIKAWCKTKRIATDYAQSQAQ